MRYAQNVAVLRCDNFWGDDFEEITIGRVRFNACWLQYDTSEQRGYNNNACPSG